jgi:phospholipid transport system substrate-binding protein
MKRALVRFRRRDAIRLLAAAAVLPLVNLPWLARRAWSAVDPAAAEAAVQSLAAQIWQSLGRTDLGEEARIDAIAAVLVQATDVELLSRLALARYWQRLDDEQKDRYRALFRDVVMRSFASRLNRYTEDARGPLEERFTILSSAPAGKQDVLVRSQVRPLAGGTLAVDWRLRGGESGPVIIDVIIEGVSLLVSQRSEFAAVIERSDMEGLLAELQARAGSTRS